MGLEEWRSENVKDSNGRKAQVVNEHCGIQAKCPVAEGVRYFKIRRIVRNRAL